MKVFVPFCDDRETMWFVNAWVYVNVGNSFRQIKLELEMESRYVPWARQNNVNFIKYIWIRRNGSEFAMQKTPKNQFITFVSCANVVRGEILFNCK